MAMAADLTVAEVDMMVELGELDPECPDVAFALCDLGMGCPD